MTRPYYGVVQHATSKCGFDGLISSAGLFCPSIIQIKDYIFVKEFWNHDEEDSLQALETLEKQYNYDKKKIEMAVNSWSLGDFFVGSDSPLMDNEKIFQEFGDVLVYFWKQRVKELFPERNVVVKTGHELMGEFGLCITMYEE